MKIFNSSEFLPGMILALFLISCSCTDEKKEQTISPPEQNSEQSYSVINEDTTWIRADIMPLYRGGERALMDYLGRAIVYPEVAMNAGIQGQVVARFRVGSDGKISMVSILKGVDPLLDAETVRVINSISFEKPGYIGKRAVPVWYVLPVVYSLN